MRLIQTLTTIFSPRELALLTLALASVFFGLLFKAARKGAGEMAVIFFSKQLFRIYALMIGYVACFVYILFLLGAWDMSLLKDTIKWFLFAATVMFFKVQKFQESKEEYTKTFQMIFTGSTLLEFFTDKFSFGYFTELLLIPLATFLTLLRLMTEKGAKYAQVDKFFRGCLMLIGFYFLGHLVYSAITQWHYWFNLDGLKEFALAPVCSLLLLPFIFLLTVYMTYQTQLVVLDRKLSNHVLLKYAKRKAIMAFGLDQRSLARWQSRLQFDHIHTKEEVRTSIAELKKTQATERNPPIVPYEKGWSPYAAKNFLNPVFTTRYYDPTFEDHWMAGSNSVYPGDYKYSNNYFRYEVLGYADVTTALELHLTVMAPLDTIDLVSPLLAYAALLYKNATQNDLPEKLENAVINGKNCKLNVAGTKIRYTKEIWPNTLNDCYSMTLAFYRGKPIKF